MAIKNSIGVYVPNPPSRTSVATVAAIEVVNRNTTYYPANPIVPGDQSYDSTQVREPGQVIFDPVTGLHAVTYSCSPSNGTDPDIAMYLSANGEHTWHAHPDNPITTTRAEDPYLCKDITTGHLYRDGSGRAYLYTEEKPSFDGQRGIDLWRSTANTLSGWSYYGRVVDQGGVGDWDESFRASPIVFHDGTSFHMLFEGGSPTNEGEVGYASSSDGLSWTVAADPIITRATAGAWNDQAIVNDDIMKIGSTYVLLVHCKGSNAGNSPGFNNLGRYATTVAPGSWVDGSFVEMAGNPYYQADSNTAMFVHNDPGRCVIVIDNGQYWFADYALA